jgi:hypothetical protein
MLSGTTPSALAIAGTAVFRIVVSSDSIKNAIATSHGNKRLLESLDDRREADAAAEFGIFIPGNSGRAILPDYHSDTSVSCAPAQFKSKSRRILQVAQHRSAGFQTCCIADFQSAVRAKSPGPSNSNNFCDKLEPLARSSISEVYDCFLNAPPLNSPGFHTLRQMIMEEMQ